MLAIGHCRWIPSEAHSGLPRITETEILREGNDGRIRVIRARSAREEYVDDDDDSGERNREIDLIEGLSEEIV